MELETIKTTRGELQYYRDWDNYEGGIVMVNPQTIKRYRNINKTHPDPDSYGVFFAFNKEQFNESVNRLERLGTLPKEAKLCAAGYGLYGTRNSITEFLNAYKHRDKAIPKECDPQEVYFYEFDNHECMYSWDGDSEAIKIIINIWGADVARTIRRFDATQSIDQLTQNN